MNITTKYSIGDSVWVLAFDQKYHMPRIFLDTIKKIEVENELDGDGLVITYAFHNIATKVYEDAVYRKLSDIIEQNESW